MKSIERNVSTDIHSTDELIVKAESYAEEIAKIVANIDYKRPESSLAITTDVKYQSDVQSKIEHLKGARHVFLVGIGGSSLGTEAVYDALALRTDPRLHVYDTIDNDALSGFGTVMSEIEHDAELAVVVVSKSGTTTETITNATLLLNAFEKAYGKEIVDRVVFVGTHGTEFLKLGKKHGVTCVEFPAAIGGRYSVFTAAGVVPLTLLAVDIPQLLEGATSVTAKEALAEAVKHAAQLAVLAKEGIHTVNLFAFEKHFRTFGLWYRQLLAESIGKKETCSGAPFEHQLLPTTATVVDLHSMAQLYLGGYKGIVTHFVHADSNAGQQKLPEHWLLEAGVMLKGYSPKDINTSIRKGVLKAYDKEKLPYRLTTSGENTAYTVGQLMGSLMLETMLLGHIFDVNVFDQPNVESYKSFTRTLLEK
jgi:glucose-6-phosphate isomerase